MMNKTITVTERPDDITYGQIHSLLAEAHKQNKDRGFHVKTADMDAAALESLVGESGKCFVALDGEKLVGVTAVNVVERSGRFVKGKNANQILVAVLPEYSGRHISSLLHEQVVRFAKENGLCRIELRTAEENVNMQRACRKWGFRYVDFVTYTGIDHYTVVMCKWLDGCPYDEKTTERYYRKRKFLTKIRYRKGKIRRFGI